MATLRLTRFVATCEQCGKDFVAVERPNKKLQRYCSGECQRESREANDLPDEVEIKRRAEVIKNLREKCGIVKITQGMLDWYDDQTPLLHSDSLSRVNANAGPAVPDVQRQ